MLINMQLCYKCATYQLKIQGLLCHFFQGLLRTMLVFDDFHSREKLK